LGEPASATPGVLWLREIDSDLGSVFTPLSSDVLRDTHAVEFRAQTVTWRYLITSAKSLFPPEVTFRLEIRVDHILGKWGKAPFMATERPKLTQDHGLVKRPGRMWKASMDGAQGGLSLEQVSW
jgi:hypothetical protein